MYFRIFDCWRLTAAMLIMIYHFLYQAPPSGEAGIAFLHRLLPLLDMFFMISGFLIMHRYGAALRSPSDCLRFLRRRFARIYPLHLITLAFFAAIAGAVALGWVHSEEPRRWVLADLPLHILAVHAWGTTDYLAYNYPSWSVSAEFFCYLLFPLIVLVANRGGLAGLLALLVACVAALEIATARGAFGEGHWTTADTLGAYRAFADFVLGAVMAQLLQRRPFEVGSHLPGLAALALAICGMLLGWNVYLVLGCFAAAMLLTGLEETARPDSTRALQFLMPVSRVSFGIYLWHPVMETLFLSLIWKRFLEPTGLVSFYEFWLLPMLATVVVAMLSERLVEKRLGDLLAGVRRKSAAGAPSARRKSLAPLPAAN